MFVDASAIISILSGEEDAESLAERLDGAPKIYVSAVCLYEAATGLSRKRTWSLREAEEIVDEFIRETSAEIVVIDRDVARTALRAFQRFGKGRHPAGLNMGDCFAYACASIVDAPLLFKGEDFSQTDITIG
jgi:ribonuclease VapC